MSLILMCKNTPVYRVDTEEILNMSLIPPIIGQTPCNTIYKLFFKHRYSSQTNMYARKERSLIWGQGNRERINKDTYSLSLSDCYWLKDESNNIDFYSITPYLHYKYSPAKPTLYTNGFKSKYWLDSKTLIKYDCNIELITYNFCKFLNIPINKIEKYSDNEIAIENFTSLDEMLEPASTSGLIDPENFTSEDILKAYGIPALDMLVVDALLGNGDRHSGNFGYLKSTETGEITKFAPLYDFDHTFDSKNENDILIKEILTIYNTNERYRERIYNICNYALSFENEIRLYNKCCASKKNY